MHLAPCPRSCCRKGLSRGGAGELPATMTASQVLMLADDDYGPAAGYGSLVTVITK